MPFGAEMEDVPHRGGLGRFDFASDVRALTVAAGHFDVAVTLWTLSKRGKVAPLVLLTHQLGWKLRIDSRDLLLTQDCKSDREIEDVSAAWKAGFIEKGWS